MLGPTTAGFIRASEAGADKTDSPCTVRPECSHQDLSRCLSIWARSSIPPGSGIRSSMRPVHYQRQRDGMHRLRRRPWLSHANYILGRLFLIETDHEPLVPILSTKHLDDLPLRVLRFRLRLARFNYTMHHAYTQQIAVYCRHLVTRTSTNRRPQSPLWRQL